MPQQSEVFNFQDGNPNRSRRNADPAVVGPEAEERAELNVRAQWMIYNSGTNGPALYSEAVRNHVPLAGGVPVRSNEVVSTSEPVGEAYIDKLKRDVAEARLAA